MSKTEKLLGAGILIAILIAIGAYSYPQVQTVVENTNKKFGQILDTFTGDYFNVVTANGGGAFQINGTNVMNNSTTTLGSSGVPYYYSRGGKSCADTSITLSSGTSTAAYLINPFPTATSTFPTLSLDVSSSSRAYVIDIATTSKNSSASATTSAVLVKALSVPVNQTGANVTYFWYPNSATTTVSNASYGVPTGVLPGNFTNGASTNFLRPAEGIAVIIATSSMDTTAGIVGTLTETVCKP